MVKNHEIKFPVEKDFKEDVDGLREGTPKLRNLYSKSGFYLLIFKLGLLSVRNKNFDNLELDIQFKKKT